MVPNTSELLPDPDTPVNTVSLRLGSSTFTFFRLFSRAPRTRIRSWVSAVGWVAVLRLFVAMLSLPVVAGRVFSVQFLDADHGARGISHGAVSHPVGLLGRLLHDLGVARLQSLEGGV